MRAHLLLCAGTVLLAACSANLRTMAYDPAPGDAPNVRTMVYDPTPGDAPNVTVYLSNQRPAWGRASLAVYVDDRLVVRHAPGLDIHAHHEVELRLPPGPHRIRVTGPNGTSATREVVVGTSPLFICVSWWSTRGTEPIAIEVYEGEMPGFC